MDDREIDVVLERHMSVLSKREPNPLFVRKVMARIDASSSEPVVQRELVVALACIAGIVIAVASMMNLDLTLFMDVRALISAVLESALGSPAWHWMVIILPLLWFTLTEA